MTTPWRPRLVPPDGDLAAAPPLSAYEALRADIDRLTVLLSAVLERLDARPHDDATCPNKPPF